MRCKKHLTDHSSSVGVCASCLRQRLVSLIAAQAQGQALISEDRRKQQQQHQDAPPLVFPRSVSPYVSRRKSDDTTPSTWAYPHRFYSTPQVGPTFTAPADFAVKKRSGGKFSLISKLFRSRSHKYNSDRRVASRDSTEPSSSFPSSSFFHTIFPSRRKKKSTLCYADDSKANCQTACRISNRGMSPARESESDDDYDRSLWGSGGSTDEWRRTPVAAAPAVRRTRTTTTTHSKSVSGLAFCLSPLVRASPNRHWSQKGGLAPELVYPGEVRCTVKPHLSTAASFCANRSRKLADFGRVNHNR